jgi:hypothetical protein
VAVAHVSRRSQVAVLAALALAAAAPAAARAGTYSVVSCDAAPHGANNAWVGTATPKMAVTDVCPTGLAPQHGIAALAKTEVGLAAQGATAEQAFDAPPGAAIVSLSTHLSMHRKETHWAVGVYADGKLALGCGSQDAGNLCLYSAAWPATAKVLDFPQGVRRVSAKTTCGRAAGCPTDDLDSGPFPERAGIRLYSTTVRLRDDTLPALSDTKAGPLTNGAWQRGSRTVAYAASDNVGIRTTRLYVDGQLREDLAPPCDFTQRAPCPNVPAGRYAVDTQALPDGTHQLRIEAVDTASNVARLSTAFRSDNTPPDAPQAVSVDGGEGWRSVNGFRVGWRPPAGAAPIAAAHYELCGPGGCTTGERRGAGVASIADLAVPGPGDYTVRVWLEDAAGNVNDGNRSAPVHLRFDDAAPGMAAPVAHERWLSSAELEEPIAMGLGQLVPVSGIAGYSVTTDGSEPDATIDTDGATFDLTGLRDGVVTVRARAVSGAGVPSPYVGATDIRVDRSPPSTSVGGVPTDSGWRRDPVTLLMRGVDQPGLSGMEPASAGEPVEAGAYVEYSLDGADPVRLRGEAAELTLTGDGQHSVAIRAVDAAGNRSDARTVQVRIDRTPPEAAFEPQSATDPRRLAVAAADPLSGIAGAAIQLRRAGSGEPWRALPTGRTGAGFAATIDDRVLTGLYELRAVVVDRAGNVAIADRRRDGSPAIVDASTLRAATRVSAGIARGAALTSRATIGFGRGATARGTLARASGARVPGAQVEVWSRPASAGAPYRLVARVRTNAAGAFSYPIAAGPSRIVRFRYAGSPVERPSQGDVTVVVPAAATIGASRHRVRNGQRVTFSGALLGRPIPRAGKVVDLQAFYRGRWRTFATPSAGSDGRWRYTYRFGATRGRLVYRFRVMVRPESSYPYALGYSRTTAVTVTG